MVLSSLVLRRLVVALFGLVVLLGTRGAWARSAGIASSEFVNRTPPNCNACHSNHGTAQPPLVMLTASDVTLNPSQQITLTFVVTRQSSGQTAAGFNIRTSLPGTFVLGGPDSAMTRTAEGATEITHSAPKPVTGETTTFTALWTPANATSGMVTFTAFGNSVNLSGNNQGDYATGTTLDVTVASTCTPTNWYADADADGYGNPAAITNSCNQPAGHVANNTDCNDTVAAINPGATEVCNAIDDNCTAGVDEGLATTTFYRDIDGDTYGAAGNGTKAACNLAQAGAGYVVANTDCNDSNAAINPAAAEVCNGIDDNCAGGIDDGLATTTYYTDIDADGYGSPSGPTKAACSQAQAGSGFVTTNTDCNDNDTGINPGIAEVCGNAKDDNCNGTVDTDAASSATYYKDNDGDGFGAAASGMMTACSMPTGYVSSNTDCNDASTAVKPGATETCNGVDDNCTGGVDEGLTPLTCGTGACVTMVPACAGGVVQTCTPVCPDAGADASDAGDGSTDTTTDSKPDTAADVPKDTTTVDQAKPDTTADAPKTDTAADTTPSLDAGAETSKPDATADARDAGKDAPTVAPADDGCGCDLGGAKGDGSLAGPAAAALLLLALVRRRRRQG
jgi:MYXO-CTERM domain-containing protein